MEHSELSSIDINVVVMCMLAAISIWLGFFFIPGFFPDECLQVKTAIVATKRQIVSRITSTLASSTLDSLENVIVWSDGLLYGIQCVLLLKSIHNITASPIDEFFHFVLLVVDVSAIVKHSNKDTETMQKRLVCMVKMSLFITYEKWIDLALTSLMFVLTFISQGIVKQLVKTMKELTIQKLKSNAVNIAGVTLGLLENHTWEHIITSIKELTYAEAYASFDGILDVVSTETQKRTASLTSRMNAVEMIEMTISTIIIICVLLVSDVSAGYKAIITVKCLIFLRATIDSGSLVKRCVISKMTVINNTLRVVSNARNVARAVYLAGKISTAHSS
jgi:hypothetical protein